MPSKTNTEHAEIILHFTINVPLEAWKKILSDCPFLDENGVIKCLPVLPGYGS